MEATDAREKKIRRTLIIEPSLWEHAQTMAEREDVSTSWLIRKLIREASRRSDRAARKSP